MWRATKAAIADGYPVKSVNLSIYADRPDQLRQRCDRLQAEMLSWVSGRRGNSVAFDGTFKRLIQFYQTEPESNYHKLKPSTLKPYDVYARLITAEIGERRINACDGRDALRWFAAWSEPEKAGGKPTIPKARMAMAVLTSALSFGIQCRLPGCAEFMTILKEIPFPSHRPRTEAPTWEEVVKLRAGARNHGHASAALAYAIQFDGIARQWDVIGQWVPLSDPRPSALIDAGEKWLGPTWERNIDENLVFRFKPTKTEFTTEKEVVLDLRVCPMVMEELPAVTDRKGPLIVNPNTGLPYRQTAYQKVWHAAAKHAGVPKTVWNRDLRAGGITEGRAAAVGKDDLAKIAGHNSGRMVATVYDRDHLEAQRRAASARTLSRTDKPE